MQVSFVDIRTILYVHVYLLVGMAVGLTVIACNPHFRHFRNLAAAFIAGAASALVRIADAHLPSYVASIFAKGMLFAMFVLIHRSLADFVQGGSRTKRLEVLLVGSGCLGLAFFTLVYPSPDARLVVINLVCGVVAMLSILTLLRCADTTVRVPCVATAIVLSICVLTMVLRIVEVLLHSVPGRSFASSFLSEINLFGYELVIVGVPLGFFWMTATRLTRLWGRENQLARTDPLTGLHNRRAIEEWGERAMAQSRSRFMSFTVLAIDVDHFKHINDRFGHKAGDVALRALAQALKAAVRKEDLVARLGGEEFIALLWNEGVERTLITAERIRQIIESLDIHVDDQVINVTVSSGVAVFEAHDTLETVLRRADRALYAAKLAGRNRVMLEPSLLPAD
jgi:diguanylate cyclase (GGDEF)-like protein